MKEARNIQAVMMENLLKCQVLAENQITLMTN